MQVNKKSQKISVIGVRAFPADFVGTSGIEVYVENVIKRLIKLDQNLAFNIYTKSNYQSEKKVSKRIKIIKIFTISSKVFESIIYSFISSFFSIFDSSKIVWYHGIGQAVFFFLPKLFGKKIIITIHAFDWQRKKWNKLEKFLFKIVAKFIFMFNKNIFVVSKKMQKQIKKQIGINANIALPGIHEDRICKKQDLDFFQKKYQLKNSDYLLYLGRIVPEKRLEWLIEDFLQFKKKYKRLKLIIAGGHGNLPLYEKRLKEIFVHQDIIWTGYIFGKEKKALLAGCRCFVLPSELEGGNPISLLEAMSFGRYCIASQSCVEKDFKKFTNLFLFKVNDKKSFKNCLKVVLRRSKENSSYAFPKQEKQMLKRYDWSCCARIYFDFFKQ